MTSEICPNAISASEGNLRSLEQPLASGWLGAELDRMNLENSIAEQNDLMEVLAFGGLGAYPYGIRTYLNAGGEAFDYCEDTITNYLSDVITDNFTSIGSPASGNLKPRQLPGASRGTIRCTD
jgi:hypothetical protein